MQRLGKYLTGSIERYYQLRSFSTNLHSLLNKLLNWPWQGGFIARKRSPIKSCLRKSAVPTKNAVSTNKKHSRYIHFISNFLAMHPHGKMLYVWNGRYYFYVWKSIDRLLFFFQESLKKTVVCMKSEMHILRFYVVGQK